MLGPKPGYITGEAAFTEHQPNQPATGLAALQERSPAARNVHGLLTLPPIPNLQRLWYCRTL
jgi:hypothetical protein